MKTFSTTRCFGVDGGSAVSGWGIVDARGSKATRVRSGSCTTARELLDALRAALADGVDLVAVESVQQIVPSDGFTAGRMGTYLAWAEYFAGGVAFATMLLAPTIPIVRVTAGEWRRWLIGKATADDTSIGYHLGLHLGGLPKGTTNEHERDGLGVAAFSAVSKALGIPFGHGEQPVPVKTGKRKNVVGSRSQPACRSSVKGVVDGR